MTHPRYLLLLILLSLLISLSGCISTTGPTPKQQAAIANDSFAVAENVLTAGLQTGLISQAENTRLIRPAVQATRNALDVLTIAVSRTPPDPSWKTALDAVNATLPSVLQYAKSTQVKASTQPVPPPIAPTH